MSSIFKRLWSGLRRWFGVPTREGRWVAASAWSARGMLSIAPLVIPQRQYLVYVPRGYTRWRRRLPLIVLCHGCRQTPEDFAQGTHIAAAADANCWLVLMPRQSNNANPWSCWNWFDTATARGNGEAAIVEAMTRKVLRRYRVDSSRVFTAGLSAGGALAVILGVRYPALFRGVIAHSAIACGAAATPLTATSVMARGPDTDVAAIGRAARDPAHRVALLAIQGMADDLVAPRNATAIVRQFLALSGVAVDDVVLPEPVADRKQRLCAHDVRVRDWHDNEGLIARLVEIGALGHAWSGGDATLAYNDTTSVDALDLIGQWMHDIVPKSARMQVLHGEQP